MRTSIALVALFAFGCGGPTLIADDTIPLDAGDATTQSDAGDAGDAGASDATEDAPFSCGTVTCQPGQLCFKPCSGGIAQCEPTNDAGTCPPGTHTSIMCQSQGNPCEPDQPPPYCNAGPCDAGLSWMPSGKDCIQLCQ